MPSKACSSSSSQGPCSSLQLPQVNSLWVQERHKLAVRCRHSSAQVLLKTPLQPIPHDAQQREQTSGKQCRLQAPANRSLHVGEALKDAALLPL